MRFLSKKMMLNIISIVLLLVGIFALVYKKQISKFYWNFTNPSPVVWQNIKIRTNDKLSYKKENDKLTLMFWGDEAKGYMVIRKFEINKPTDIVENLSSKGYVIQTKEFRSLKGNETLIIQAKQKNHQTIHYLTYFIPLKILFHFEGPEDNLYLFTGVIRDLEFL
jgi:hypothetical protein